ncbi:hypothetical protein I316_02615 [Kwoniella heveanensis BCC8398]|uniref:2-dehydropantoate 2-reductase n=1 Tax=Kwoniella heveanensis BCC8398 TaxID=1296120 RepID=A0A1B9GX23_9TREE|nr:hypothetical protein I316_02615 [Kwoniella heveanensis BCC8398]
MTGIHVLGVGSLGTLVTHHIRLSNPCLPITLLLRDPSSFPKTIRVTREGIESSSSNYDLGPSSSTSRSGEGDIESLLVTLKAPQTLSAIKLLVPRLRPNSVISLLQNGLGTYQALCSEVFPDPETRPYFILGTTAHGVAPNTSSSLGARLGGKGDVKHHTARGQGHIKWGVCPDPRARDGSLNLEKWIWRSCSPDANDCADAELKLNSNRSASGLVGVDLAKLEVPTDRADLTSLRDTLRALTSTAELNATLLPINEVDRAMLLKVAINATINPLTAILGRGVLPNGSLSTIGPSGPSMLDALVGEISVILIAHFDRQSGDGSTQQRTDAGAAAEEEGRQMFEYNHLRKLIQGIIEETAGNTSSMAVDVREKRGTEIEFINGYLVRLGEELGVPTVVNRLVCDMVRFISASQR